MFRLMILSVVIVLGTGCIKTNEMYIYSEGKGKVKVKPDMISLKLGVSTVNKSADSALKSTNLVADRLMTVMTQFGIAKEAIETYRTVLKREYQNSRDTTTYLGVKSELILRVNYYNVNETEKLLNSLISAGMNVLEDYDFEHTKSDSLRRAAAEIAITDARRNAENISKKERRKLGNLLNASYERPEDFQSKADFKIGYQDLIGNLMAGEEGGSGLELRRKGILQYLRIYVPYLSFENTVYAKFLLH